MSYRNVFERTTKAAVKPDSLCEVTDGVVSNGDIHAVNLNRVDENASLKRIRALLGEEVADSYGSLFKL